MKTPNLLHVPKDGPTRKQKLENIKRLFCIETSFFRGLDYNPWIAVHMPSARQLGYGVGGTSDLFDCISKVGRLMDEAGICQQGKTERKAVRKVCERFDFPIQLL